VTGAVHFYPWSKPPHLGQFWFCHVPGFPIAQPRLFTCAFPSFLAANFLSLSVCSWRPAFKSQRTWSSSASRRATALALSSRMRSSSRRNGILHESATTPA
jgi:hypothetical protein